MHIKKHNDHCMYCYKLTILYPPFGLHHSHHLLAPTANATTIVPLFPIYIRHKTTLIIENYHTIIDNNYNQVRDIRPDIQEGIDGWTPLAKSLFLSSHI